MCKRIGSFIITGAYPGERNISNDKYALSGNGRDSQIIAGGLLSKFNAAKSTQ